MLAVETLVIKLALAKEYPLALALLPFSTEREWVCRVLGLVGQWHAQRPDAPFSAWLDEHVAAVRAKATAAKSGSAFALVGDGTVRSMMAPLIATRPPGSPSV